MQGQLLSPPELCSVAVLLADPGCCYYVPAFQRHFAWNAGDVERFYEGIVNGIHSMNASDERNDSMSETFMASIVCFGDSQPFVSVYPKIPNDYPAAVHVLIDGQQRLTVCLVTALALYDYLQSVTLVETEKLVKTKEGDSFERASAERRELDDLKKQTQQILYGMLALPTPRTGDRQYYPRMIRAISDQWSVKSADSRYHSPISHLLSSYIDYHKSDETSPFKLDSASDEKHKRVFLSVFQRVQTFIRWLATKDSNDEGADKYSFGVLPEIELLLQNEEMQKELFGRTGALDPFTSLRLIAEQEGEPTKKKIDRAIKKYKEVARLLAFSSYFLRRVKFVKMITTGEDYAFKIFDSLNTTGDPLTAFETFVPEVIKLYDSIEDYSRSNNCKMIEEIDKYLAKNKNSQDKDTKELITSFALAETGAKLSKELNGQRLYMLRKFKQECIAMENSGERGYLFIQNLLHVARTSEAYKTKRADALSTSVERCLSLNNDNLLGRVDRAHAKIAGEARFCLKFLIDCGHKIVIPLFSRFYTQYENDKSLKNHLSLCKVIRSTAAFFALWRISRLDTDSIENHHRRIMKKQSKELLPTLNFARVVNDLPNNRKLDIEALSNEYCRLLATHRKRAIATEEDGNDIKVLNLSKDKWVELSEKIPIYDKQKEVAKFILLLNSYSELSPVTMSEALFDEGLWYHKAHETIEHIKPQSSKIEDSTVKELLDSIGNLTLLPMEINSFIGDSDWSNCKLFYYAFSEKDSDEVEAKCDELELDEDLKARVMSIHEEVHRQEVNLSPALKAIAEHEEFETDQIQDRSRKILENVWDTLIKWLGSNKYTKPE